MRRCVRLRVLQDLDIDEIADLLQISPSTVKVQLFKARKRLQLELARNMISIPIRKHQEAICSLTRALSDPDAGH